MWAKCANPRLGLRENVQFFDIAYLVGGLEHFVIFPSIGNVIIPIDELIFFRGFETTSQIGIWETS